MLGIPRPPRPGEATMGARPPRPGLVGTRVGDAGGAMVGEEEVERRALERERSFLAARDFDGPCKHCWNAGCRQGKEAAG